MIFFLDPRLPNLFKIYKNSPYYIPQRGGMVQILFMLYVSIRLATNMYESLHTHGPARPAKPHLHEQLGSHVLHRLIPHCFSIFRIQYFTIYEK
jgi:hypothetical protein